MSSRRLKVYFGNEFVHYVCNGNVIAKSNEQVQSYPLRKHAHMIYSNFFRSKIDNFQRKIFDIFLIFAQNIDCGYTLEPPRRGGSNEYPQSMFWSKNKKNRYTPAYTNFTI